MFLWLRPCEPNRLLRFRVLLARCRRARRLRSGGTERTKRAVQLSRHPSGPCGAGRNQARLNGAPKKLVLAHRSQMGGSDARNPSGGAGGPDLSSRQAVGGICALEQSPNGDIQADPSGDANPSANSVCILADLIGCAVIYPDAAELTPALSKIGANDQSQHRECQQPHNRLSRFARKSPNYRPDPEPARRADRDRNATSAREPRVGCSRSDKQSACQVKIW